MAALTIQHLEDGGEAPDFALDTPSASDTADIGNGHNTFVVYRNTSGAPVDVVVHVPGNTFFGLANPDNTVSVPANGDAWIPLRRAYADGEQGGLAVITTAGAASLEVALVRVV
jgi:hypothetical protein